MIIFRLYFVLTYFVAFRSQLVAVQKSVKFGIQGLEVSD